MCLGVWVGAQWWMECADVCSPVDCDTGHGWTLSVFSISFSHSLPVSLFASIPQGQTCHVATAHVCAFLFSVCPSHLILPLLSDIYSSDVAVPLMALKKLYVFLLVLPVICWKLKRWSVRQTVHHYSSPSTQSWVFSQVSEEMNEIFEILE